MINSSSLSVSPTFLVTEMFFVTVMPDHFSYPFCCLGIAETVVRVSSCLPAEALPVALLLERDRAIVLEILALMRP